MESKNNLRYLDDENLSDVYKTMLKDPNKVVEPEKLGLQIKTSKCEFVLSGVTESDNQQFYLHFKKFTGIKTPEKDELGIFRSERCVNS